jgi:hypothetical protein
MGVARGRHEHVLPVAVPAGDGGHALRDMNEATDYAFFPFSAEWLFLQILKGYFNQHTTPDQIAIRAESIVARGDERRLLGSS